MAKKEKSAPHSALERAWRAFENGDMVQARTIATQVAAAPTDEDEATARKLGPGIFSPVPNSGVSAKVLAEEIASRTKGPPRPYLFVGVTAAIYLLMLLIASRA